MRAVATVAVLGATGRTGRPLVDQLVQRGHEVRALARRPDAMGAPPQQVHVVQGSSTDPAALETVLQGADVVVSALGPTDRHPTLHRDTARALVDVMPRVGVTRFVGVSGAGIDVVGDQKGTRDRAISLVIRTLGGALAADKKHEYEVWSASGLDWTLVRPPRLLDGPASGRVQHDAHRPGSSTIRRADLAAFLADEVEQHRYPRQAPFVSAVRA
jgi:putative NADH-flavin reductase